MQRTPPASDSEARIQQWCVAALAGFVALLAFAYCFFMKRELYPDELGFYNPIYMFVHYNKMTFPAYGYFDAMFVHPPTHYLAIGLLMKAGLDLFHAAGVPPFAFTVLTTFLVVSGRFPPAVKIGLILGPYLATFIWGEMVTLRPELDLAPAWFAGLIALESARLDAWDARRLFLGSFLLTYASGVHYVASIAFTGILVYIVWAHRDLGFTAARPKILTMIAGGALFGVPYLAFFMLPYWHAIFSLAQTMQEPGGPLAGIRMGLAGYGSWARRNPTLEWWHARPFLTALVFPIHRTLVPAAVLGPLLLLPYRTTRGIALAALPHLLFFWLYFRDHAKVVYFGYYVPEVMLYLSGMLIAMLAIVLWGAERVIPRPQRWMALAVLMPLVAAAAAANVPITYGSSASEVMFTPRLDDMDVARAAGVAMLGPRALVGSSDFAAWYVPGGAHVYAAGQELANSPDISHLDLHRYLSLFDALAQDARFDWSGMTGNKQHQTLTSWYIDGTLNLRGFYFGNGGVRSWSSALSYLLLTPHRTGPLVGYLFRTGRLYEFQERPGGDAVFLTAICPRSAPERMIPNIDPHSYGFFRLSLPGARPSTQEEGVIKILLINRLKYENMRSVLTRECTRREEAWGSLEEVPAGLLLARLHDQDRRIRFYETLTDAVEAVKGILVTPDARPFRVDRSTAVFAPDFTDGWEVTSAKPRVDVGDNPHSAKVTTDYSTYDQQLVSSAIPVSPRATYLLEFDLKVARGGAGVQVMTSDRRTTLAAHCEPASHRGFLRRRMFFKTGDRSRVTVVVANCSSLGPTTSVFWVRNMRMWGQR